MDNREISHQISATLPVALNQFGIAVELGALALILQNLQYQTEGYTFSYGEISWIMTVETISRILGAAIVAILIDRVGRKTLLSVCSITFCLTWLVIYFAKSEIFSLAFSLFGIAKSINEVTSSIYLGENSSPSIRGVLGSISICMYFLGYLTGLLTAMILNFKLAVLIYFFITFLSFVSIFWMVEPVQYLLIKGNYDQAEKNFAWLKGVTNVDEVADEFQTIKQNVYAEISRKSSIIKTFAFPANYKSLLIMLIIHILFGMMGSQLLFQFVPIYQAQTDNFIFVIIFCGIQFSAVVSSSFIIGRFDTKRMILISFAVILLIHALTAVLFFTKHIFDPLRYSWLHFLFFNIVMFAGIFLFAFRTATLFLLRSELFPLSVKGIGGSVSIIGYMAGNFLFNKIYTLLGTQMYFKYVLFSGITTILLLFIHYKLPETRHKSLIEIQKNLESEK